MIVVADTSPLNYLVLINEIHLLPQLYRTILIPAAVSAELQRAAAPAPVRSWSAHLPEWLELCTVDLTRDNRLVGLDPGEREAIVLARERGAELLLIDDSEGRREAKRHNLRPLGTLGVLAQGARHGLVNLDDALARLQETNFRATPEVIARVLGLHT